MTNFPDQPQNSYPKFFTTAQWQKLLKNGPLDARQICPVVKLFTPDASATWLLASVSPEEPELAFGLCDLGVGFPELGYVSLDELASLRGQLGLPVERDRHCVLDQTLQTYTDRADVLRRIEI
jgi:DUF2958 family protein